MPNDADRAGTPAGVFGAERPAAPDSELYRAEREIFCLEATPQEALAIHIPRSRPSSESG